jgi:K+-sensing histidine kinase KdpD
LPCVIRSINGWGEHSRFLFFTAAAILVCVYAGIWRALFVATAGLLLGFYFFVEPYESFSEPDAEDFWAIVVYLLNTSVMLFLIEWLQRSKYETRILLLEAKHKNKRLEEILDNLARAENSASINAERVDMLDDAALVQEVSRDVEKTGTRREVSVRLRLADGAYHQFKVQCARIEDKHGKVIVWSGPLAEQSLAEMPAANRVEGAK